MPYSIKAPVSNQQIADLMTTAIEGGSSYWIGSVKPRYRSHEDYSAADMYDEDMIPRVFTDNDEGEYSGTLDWISIQKGLDLLSAHPHHLAALLSDNADADTADAFLQLALFGDVIFG